MTISTLLVHWMLKIYLVVFSPTLASCHWLNYHLYSLDNFLWVKYKYSIFIYSLIVWKLSYVLDRYGRRWVHCLCMIVATVPLMLCVVFVNYNGQVVVGLTVISKVASNVGWFIMWVQCVEVSECTFYNSFMMNDENIIHLVYSTISFLGSILPQKPNFQNSIYLLS